MDVRCLEFLCDYQGCICVFLLVLRLIAVLRELEYVQNYSRKRTYIVKVKKNWKKRNKTGKLDSIDFYAD